MCAHNPQKRAVFQSKFNKKSHILLDNTGAGGYSMFAFRVNKESEKTQKTATFNGFVVALLCGDNSGCGFCVDQKNKNKQRDLNANSKSTDSEAA